MTPKQKAAVKYNLKQKYLKGQLTLTEYEDLVLKLQAMAGTATLQEANQALGLSKKAGAGAPAAAPAPAKKPLTAKQENDILDLLDEKFQKGIISGKEMNALIDKLEANKGQWSEDEAYKQLGLTKKAAPAASGMTPDEYIGLEQALLKKKDAGLISPADYTTLKGKLDDAYQQKKTVAEIEKEIGCDPGTLASDQAVIDLGKELKGVYQQAANEMIDKLQEFTAKYGPQLAEKQAMVAAGLMTHAQLDAWINGKGKMIDLMNAKIDQMSDTVLQANQKAMGMINGKMVGVFAENANYQSYQLEQDTKLNLMFTVYDEHTAERLIKAKPELLPRKIVNGAKDKPWNQKLIAGAVTQAVLQGESIPKLAKRVAVQTGETNMKAMVRYARTAMTGAQNSGRMEMLHRAAGMGIQCKKCWLATLDSRTRDSHRQMDGVKVGVDEKFKTPLGSEMSYPGDLEGLDGDIWNCRCTLTYEYDGFPPDPEFDQRLQYDEWDEVWQTTEPDGSQKEHRKHHRESSVIQDMSYGEWKAAKEGGKLNDLNAAKYELAVLQKEFIARKVSETKVYKDLWKDPVTLADYPVKKGGIQAKRDYYNDQIDQLTQAIAAGYSWASPDKLKEFKKKLKLLDEFEQHGALLEKRNAALKNVQDLYGQVGLAKTAAAPEVAKKTPAKKKPAAQTAQTAGSAAPAAATAPAKSGQFAPNAWDDATKKKAVYFARKEESDKTLRPELDAMWDTLTDEEKYSIWQYTKNSNPMNKRLSGYGDTGSWSRSAFVGFGNTEWGLEDVWRFDELASAFKKFGKDGHPEFHRVITNLTKAIDKTSLGRDMWFKRQGGAGDFAGMMEGGGFKFEQIASLLDGTHSQKELEAALVGQRGKNNAFTSVGIAKDAKWNGNVWYNIYAPKGTHCIYAEPQSHYGDSMGGRDQLYKKGSSYRGIGSEAEVIMQRGTEYRITAIRQKMGRYGAEYEVDMEIVAQPDYFTHGDEDTYNDGKTRHKK